MNISDVFYHLIDTFHDIFHEGISIMEYQNKFV